MFYRSTAVESYQTSASTTVRYAKLSDILLIVWFETHLLYVFFRFWFTTLLIHNSISPFHSRLNPLPPYRVAIDRPDTGRARHDSPVRMTKSGVKF